MTPFIITVAITALVIYQLYIVMSEFSYIKLFNHIADVLKVKSYFFYHVEGKIKM